MKNINFNTLKSYSFLKNTFRNAFLWFIFSTNLLFSQENDTIKAPFGGLGARPKIGLVLSGGGAKGLAHIGVLKVLEEAGVKIDYIGGTSMGAIVGGLYAAGYSAHQLDSIFNHVDADAILQDLAPRKSRTFYEKKNDDIYALALPFSNLKIGVPTALSKGLYNFNLLSRLTYHVSHINNFDQLKTPFVCIGTNIETGEEVVFKNGNLALMMMASGAFPTLYNPVEIEGKIYVDGGVINNYPIEEVRKMGADIIIGVDVQDGLKNREVIKDVSDVVVQISNFSMIEKMGNKRNQTDIYIKPDISGFSVVSFDKGKEIIKIGEEAGFVHFDTLKKLAFQQKQEPKSIKIIDSLYFDDIKINNLTRYTKSYILGKLKFKTHKKISYKRFEEGIYNLNSSQNFRAISYNFKTENNQKILELNLTENPVNTYFKLALHYDELFKSGALINVTTKNALQKNDYASLDLVFGDHFRYKFNYYFDNGFYWGYGLSSSYQSFNKNIANDFNNGETLQTLGLKTLNIDFTDLTHKFYVQTILAQKFVSGVGVEHKHLVVKSATFNETFNKNNYFSAYGYAQFDSYDAKIFPKKGWYFNGQLKTYISASKGADFEKFSQFKADFGTIYTFKKLTFELQTEGGFTISDKNNPFFDFVLGGYGYAPFNNFRHFYGYDFLSLVGNSYVKARGTANLEFARKNHLNFSINVANIGYDIFEDGSYLDKPKYSGYAFGYGLETVIGAIELKHSWSPDTRNHYTWLSLGYWF